MINIVSSGVSLVSNKLYRVTENRTSNLKQKDKSEAF